MPPRNFRKSKLIGTKLSDTNVESLEFSSLISVQSKRVAVQRLMQSRLSSDADSLARRLPPLVEVCGAHTTGIRRDCVGVLVSELVN